jgi:acetyltransferase-like isoleucine patch superfamily enzyme
MPSWDDLRAVAVRRGWRSGFLHVLVFAGVYFVSSYVLVVLGRVAPPGLTAVCHRLRGVKVGSDVVIDRFAIIDGSYPEQITIDDEVRIAPGAVIVAHYQPGATLARYSPPYVKPVRLGRSSFIGANAVIMPGVTVGECAIVMGGSVVLRDVDAYDIVSGNPARVISRVRARR